MSGRSENDLRQLAISIREGAKKDRRSMRRSRDRDVSEIRSLHLDKVAFDGSNFLYRQHTLRDGNERIAGAKVAVCIGGNRASSFTRKTSNYVVGALCKIRGDKVEMVGCGGVQSQSHRNVPFDGESVRDVIAFPIFDITHDVQIDRNT